MAFAGGQVGGSMGDPATSLSKTHAGAGASQVLGNEDLSKGYQMTKLKLLGSASALVIALGMASAALADDSQSAGAGAALANDNSKATASTGTVGGNGAAGTNAQ